MKEDFPGRRHALYQSATLEFTISIFAIRGCHKSTSVDSCPRQAIISRTNSYARARTDLSYLHSEPQRKKSPRWRWDELCDESLRNVVPLYCKGRCRRSSRRSLELPKALWTHLPVPGKRSAWADTRHHEGRNLPGCRVRGGEVPVRSDRMYIVCKSVLDIDL